MPVALFELGEHSATGPAYDLEAAANFYLPIQEKAQALGHEELAARLGRMVEIDTRTVEEASLNGFAPVFMNPDAYPIEGETPSGLQLVSALRRLVTRPSKRELLFGSVINDKDSEHDRAVIKQVDELEELVVVLGHQRVTCLEPDYRTLHTYLPTVIPGVTLIREELEGDSNKGLRGRLPDGSWGDFPPKPVRKVTVKAYKASSTPVKSSVQPDY